MNAWEENRLLTSGVVRLREVNLDFEDDDEAKVCVWGGGTAPCVGRHAATLPLAS